MLRRLTNPVFFGLLLLSFVFWYTTKLGRPYITDINIPVQVDSVEYKVRVNVEGLGYNILAHNFAPRRNSVKISSEYATTPSAVNPGAYIIPSYTLQNLISQKISDLKIISVDTQIEIMPPTGSGE